MTSPLSLEILEPGLVTAVQDSGRFGWEAFGIPQGGALDLHAYTWANRLAANPEATAVLEAALTGPTFTVSDDVWLATTGADRLAVDGYGYPPWSGFWASAGSTVSVEGIAGARAYVAMHGGIAVDPVLGSRSTNLESGFGGYEGRPLKAGDVLPIGAAPQVPYGRLQTMRHPNPPTPSNSHEIQVVAGPRDEEFPANAIQTLCGSPFRVAPPSNHMGLRLEGPAIPTVSRRGTRVSEPMPIGGVQITPSGGPIVLLNARGTIGGYPLLATVISVDVWKLGQARVGDELRFQAISVEEAQAETRKSWEDLTRLTPVSQPVPLVAGPRYAPWTPR